MLSTSSVEFTRSRYNTELAILQPSGLSFDRCGQVRPVGYLRGEVIELPSPLEDEDSKWKVDSIVGKKVTLSNSRAQTSVTIDEDIRSAVEVSNLRLSSGGSQGGVIRITGISGKERFFGVASVPYVDEYFIQPDHLWADKSRKFCEE